MYVIIMFSYPPEKAKVALAKAIVTEFSLLKDTRANKGYEHYYGEESRKGFIEYRLWTLRTNLSPSKKKYTSEVRGPSVDKSQGIGSSSSELLSKEDLDSKIAWMKYKHPPDSNRKDIEKYLMETRANRRDWILRKSPTISQIFEEYPRLLDYNGDMIDQEFEGLFKNKGDKFLEKFPSYYCARILEYAKSNCYDIYKRSEHVTDENLRSLIILADLLPTNNARVQNAADNNERNPNGKGKGEGRGKGKKRPRSEDEDEPTAKQSADATSFLVRILPEGTNLTNSVQEARTTAGTHVQPYILCARGQNRIKSFFVQGDGWFLKAHNNNSSVTAFDLLFKTYFVLNVCYPIGLQNFYNFVEHYLYDLGTETRSVVTSLHINLTNFDLQDNVVREEVDRL